MNRRHLPAPNLSASGSAGEFDGADSKRSCPDSGQSASGYERAAVAVRYAITRGARSRRGEREQWPLGPDSGHGPFGQARGDRENENDLRERERPGRIAHGTHGIHGTVSPRRRGGRSSPRETRETRKGRPAPSALAPRLRVSARELDWERSASGQIHGALSVPLDLRTQTLAPVGTRGRGGNGSPTAGHREDSPHPGGRKWGQEYSAGMNRRPLPAPHLPASGSAGEFDREEPRCIVPASARPATTMSGCGAEFIAISRALHSDFMGVWQRRCHANTSGPS
jgi:hypothetical protein